MSAALIDERTYYVTVSVEGAASPVWRSLCLRREEAKRLAEQKRDEIKRVAWNHKVRVFYRDGSPVSP